MEVEGADRLALKLLAFAEITSDGRWKTHRPIRLQHLETSVFEMEVQVDGLKQSVEKHQEVGIYSLSLGTGGGAGRPPGTGGAAPLDGKDTFMN